MNSVALSQPSQETELEQALAKSVNIGIAAAQAQLSKAMTAAGSNRATIIEGKGIDEMATGLAKEAVRNRCCCLS